MDTLEDSPSGKLYSYDPDGSLTVLDEGIIIQRTKADSTAARCVLRDTRPARSGRYDHDLDTGAVANRRTPARVDTSSA